MEICGNEIRVDGRFIRIARLDLDKYEFVGDPETVVERLLKSRTRVDVFTFLQKLPESLEKPLEGLPRYSYPMEMDNLAVLPVSTFDHWWNHQIRSYPRNRARQAEKKGIILKEVGFNEDLVRGIWEIYNECPVRQGKPFGHYGKNLETVRQLSATYLERSIFIGAYFEGRLIGFIKLVTDRAGTQANMMHIISTIEHRDKAPTNALIAHAVRSCADRGIRYLVYQNFSYGNRQGHSLSHFKEINGFLRVNLPRYYVPLTSVGRIALKLRLHRTLADRLPEPILDKLVSIRASWYNRNARISTEAQ